MFSPDKIKFRHSSKAKKLYSGSYSYKQNQKNYALEEFEVWQETKKISLFFYAQLTGSTLSGELISFQITYIVNNEFIPREVHIHRRLGNHSCEEKIFLDQKHDSLRYDFKDREQHKQHIIPVNTHFFIATPASVTSSLFSRNLRSQRSYYNTISTPNLWGYNGAPYSKNLIIEEVVNTKKVIRIQEKTYPVQLYKVYESVENKSLDDYNYKDMDCLDIWINRNLCIPSSIEDNREHTVDLIQLKNHDLVL